MKLKSSQLPSWSFDDLAVRHQASGKLARALIGDDASEPLLLVLAATERNGAVG
jgi:hypothetical protein